MTTTAMLLLFSAALIAAGVALIWRDVHRGRREGFLPRRSPPAAIAADPQLEVTVAPRAAEPAPRRPAASAVPPPGSTATATDGPPNWAALQPVIAEAVERVNAVLAAAGVEIGAAGEPSWSIGRRYGVHRR